MKILKLKIEKCGDCPNILFQGDWICTLLHEQVSLKTIPMLCPLEDDLPKTCSTCKNYEICNPESFFTDDMELIRTRFGCIYHMEKK